MKPLGLKGLGDAYLRLLNPPTFGWRMRHQGVADLSKIAGLDAYLVLLRRTDNDRAFLKIILGFELTRANVTSTSTYSAAARYRSKSSWGRRTRPLKVTAFDEIARRAAGVAHPPDPWQTLPARRSFASPHRVDHRAGRDGLAGSGERLGRSFRPRNRGSHHPLRQQSRRS